MPRSLFLPARPGLFLATLLVAVACASGPAAAQSSVTDPATASDCPGVETGVGGTIAPDPSTGCTMPGKPGDPGAGQPGGPGGGKPGQPGGGGVPAGPLLIDPEPQWQPISPTLGLINLRPQAWDHVQLSPDGRTLTVYFWAGIQPCYALAEVRVARDASGATIITLMTGESPVQRDMACVDLAVGYRTTLTLASPLVIDGSQPVLD